MEKQGFKIIVATEQHQQYAQIICDEMASSAKARGTGIAKRTAEYIANKMKEGKSVIALTDNGEWAGFCYIETWEHGKYLANSGLIVAPQFRKSGLAREIKQKVFVLSRKKYPDAKIFGLTTGLTVMKINSDLGYKPVTYSELTKDDEFWKGCQSCVNFEILKSKDRQNCMCTAMLMDPNDKQKKDTSKEFKENSKLYDRFMRIKKAIMLKSDKSSDKMSVMNAFLMKVNIFK